MAVVKNIKINVDTKDAVKETDNLTQSLKEVDGQAEKTGTGIKDVGENGGAIAILDSLTGGLATRFRDAYEATKLFNFSLKGTRAALVATGIGLFVVALATVVAYWDEINDFMSGTTRRLEKQHEAYQRIISDLDQQLELNKLDQEIAVKKGESTAELLRLEKEILLEKQKTIQVDLANLRLQLENEESKKREFTLLEKGLVALKGYVLGYDKIGQSVVEAYGFDVISDIEGQIKDLTLLAKQTESALLGEGVQAGDGIVRGPQTNLTNGLTPEDLIILDSKKILTEELSLLQTGTANEIKANALAETILAEQVKDAKIGIAQNTLALIGSIAKEGSALGKGVAVAQATISGFQGVQNAFTTASASPVTSVFPAYPFIQAGLAGAFSAVQIGKILSTKPVETGAPNLGGSGGGGRPSAPSFNLVSGTATNQIANSIGNQPPVQSFVVSTAVTSSQELDRNAVSNGTL